MRAYPVWPAEGSISLRIHMRKVSSAKVQAMADRMVQGLWKLETPVVIAVEDLLTQQPKRR